MKKNEILSMMNQYLYDSLLPMNMNYLYNTGSILGLFLMMQMCTGFFLSMFYLPNMEFAFNSVDFMMSEINYGWLMSYMHTNTATLFFLMVYMHMVSGLLYGSYQKTATWMMGVMMFLLMMMTAFMGYVLPWGQMSLWGATVMTNLCTTMPLMGKELTMWLWGGYNMGNPTLNSFYSFHYMLPFMLVALVMAHLMTLHDKGGTNPLTMSNMSLMNFHPYYTLKDILGYLMMGMMMMGLMWLMPDMFNHNDNSMPADFLVTPAHMVPEMYLLSFYGMLSSMPDKTGGVVMMLSSMLMLLMLPWMNNHMMTTSYFSPMYYYMTLMFMFNFMLLTWMGQTNVEYPYTLMGLILTLMYFMYFMMMPMMSFMEYMNYMFYTSLKSI